MQITYLDEVDFIGVAGRSDLNDIQKFITSFTVEGFPHVYDSDGTIWTRYGVSSQPAWVFINGNGESQRIFGMLGKTALEENVQQLLTG